jgi:hypothetical protein
LRSIAQHWTGKPIVPIERGAATDIIKVVLQLSISIFLKIEMLEPGRFPSKTDGNFIFRILIPGVAVGWT